MRPEEVTEAIATAWEQGYLAAYYQERGYGIENLDMPLETPWHLEDYIKDWNPYRKAAE